MILSYLRSFGELWQPSKVSELLLQDKVRKTF